MPQRHKVGLVGEAFHELHDVEGIRGERVVFLQQHQVIEGKKLRHEIEFPPPVVLDIDDMGLS